MSEKTVVVTRIVEIEIEAEVVVRKEQEPDGYIRWRPVEYEIIDSSDSLYEKIKESLDGDDWDVAEIEAGR